MESGQEELNLDDVSLLALRPATSKIIADSLNKRKVLTSEEGLPRDWRGLAQLTGLPEPTGMNPTSQLLQAWQREASSSMGLLVSYLGRLDRWDIVQDCYHLIKEDAKNFISTLSKTLSKNEEILERIIENQILTHEDAVRLYRGEKLRTYDALLLHADEDQQLADDMAERLNSLLLCHKDDLIGGYMYPHRGMMGLIKERCNHVVVIVTNNLLRSPINQFLIAFAQMVAIETERRIIIPCLYDSNLTLPLELNLLHKLDFNRQALRHYDFWYRLTASIVSPRTTAPPLTADETLAISQATQFFRELSNCSSSNVLEEQENVSSSSVDRASQVIQSTSSVERSGKVKVIIKAHKSTSDIAKKKSSKPFSKFINKIKSPFKLSSKKRVAVEA